MSKNPIKPVLINVYEDPGLQYLNQKPEPFNLPGVTVKTSNVIPVYEQINQVITNVINVAMPNGSNSEVQFNNNGNLSGDNTFTYIPGTDTLTVTHIVANSIVLGDVADTKLEGGNNGDVLKTDGTGNLSFGAIFPSVSGQSGKVLKTDGITQVSGAVSYNDLTNTPSFATQSYVNNAISDLINGAPSALNTLNELANALGNNASYASTITTALSDKANSSDLSDVAFSGSYNDLSDTPTIPSLTGLATESFVTTRGYLTSSDVSTTLSSYASKTYVGEQGFITSATLSSGGYITSSALTGYALSTDIPSDISELTDNDGLLGQAGVTSYNDLTDQPIISDTNGLTGGDFFIAKDETTIQLGQWAAQAITIGSSGIQIAGTGGVEIAGVAGAGITLGGETSGTITFSSATSGISYDDLSNTPSITSIPDQDGHTGQFLKTDGTDLYWDNAGLSYNDLSDLPTIPTLPTSANGYLRSTNEGVLSWDTPTISTLTDGTVTNSQILWPGGTGSSLVDQPEFGTVSLITDQGNGDGYYFNFRYDGILQVPGQIYDVNGNPVINREAQFEYKQFDDFNADINKRYIVRTQNNPVTVTLPSTESLAGGEAIFFADAYNTFSVENSLIITGGYIGDSSSDTYVMETPGSYIGIFNTGNGRWRIYSQGAQSPASSGGSFSGDYNDLSNTPDLSGYVTGTPWNDQGFITSADIPSIPTSLSDFGITAGMDGQVLTLNSSLVPVWSTPSSGGGTTDRLVNGDYSFILDIHGAIVATNGTIGPTQAGEFGFGADTGANAVIKANGGFSTWTFKSDNTLQLPAGGDIVDSTGTTVLGGSASTGSITFVDNSILGTDDVTIGFDLVASPAVSFSFTQNGTFTAPTIETGVIGVNGATINTTDVVECLPNTDTVVYTSINLLTSTIKALFHVEGTEPGTETYEAQSCEMMVARMSNRVTGSVYGLAYTGTSPLATFNARYNSQADIVEISCRPTSTTDSVYVRTNATEMLMTA